MDLDLENITVWEEADEASLKQLEQVTERELQNPGNILMKTM